ncbi:MAG: hypothetical protein C5B43_02010 [Verrucomicrobia bacterium]|nr:MAG: hypothetical protein C5B43_02010 [Verrucomicrobiota bacterium]
MKKLILSIILSGIALAANANMVPCKQHNWYVQVTGSYGLHNKTKIKDTSKFGATERKLGRHHGVGGALAVGYIMDCWRLELEGSHRQRYAHSHNSSLMANIYYDIPVTDIVSLYLGAGAGVSSVNFDTVKRNRSGSKAQKKYSHQDTVFAWQIMTGLSFALADNVDLITGYRLFATSKPTLVKEHHFKSKSKNIPLINSVEVGLRFKF